MCLMLLAVTFTTYVAGAPAVVYALLGATTLAVWVVLTVTLADPPPVADPYIAKLNNPPRRQSIDSTFRAGDFKVYVLTGSYDDTRHVVFTRRDASLKVWTAKDCDPYAIQVARYQLEAGRDPDKVESMLN